MQLIRYLLFFLAVSILSACNYQQWADGLIPHEEVEFAKKYLSALKVRNIEEIQKHLGPQLKSPDLQTKFEEVSNYFPAGDPIKVDLIGSNTTVSTELQRTNLSFQYEFSNTWLVANIVLEKRNGNIVVTGVHVNRIPESLEQSNAFKFAGKNAVHYVFLSLAVLIPVFVIYVLILCVRTPVKRKWLWILFILFGFAGFTLNWTSGQVDYQLASVHVLGAGAFTTSKFTPWFITISFPLGAVLFLTKRKKLIQPSKVL